MKNFDRSVGRVRRTLVVRYGEEQANTLIKDSRQKYEFIIPQIPYIGDRNPFLAFLLPATRYLAIYRALKEHGRTVDDAGQLIYEIGAGEIAAIPGPVRRLIGYLWFSRWFLGRLKRQAIESQEREYPESYVLSYVEGNGRDFDFGVDYTECASCKFLNVQNSMELAPYVCAVDNAASELMGWGLTRKMTLAEGYEKCDFRFKKGGKTDVPMPKSLMPVE